MSRTLRSAVQQSLESETLPIENPFVISLEEAEEMQGLQIALENIQTLQEESSMLNETLVSLENLYDQVENMEEFSAESYHFALQNIGHINHQEFLSLESVEGEGLDKELSLEKISNIWGRIKQLYVEQWHLLVDGISALIGGLGKTYKRHISLYGELKNEWDEKKGDLETKKHVTAILGNATMVLTKDDRLIRNLVKDLEKDLEYARYIVIDHQEKVNDYADGLLDTVSKGKFDSDEAFESTVIEPIVKAGHPGDLFKLNIVDKPSSLIGNRFLVTKEGKNKAPAGDDKKYAELAKIANGRKVKHKVMNWRELFRSAELSHDIELSVKDVDTLLDHYKGYIDLLKDVKGRLLASQKTAKKYSKTSIKAKGVEDLSGENKKAVKQVGNLMKSMNDYTRQPINLELTRISNVVVSLRTIISRTIATFK